MTDASTDGGETPPLAIVDNPAEQRFEARIDGELAGVWYVRHAHRIVFTHTEVPAALEGRGIAGRLAKHALDRARADGLRVVARCPFITSYIARHPEYKDLLSPT